MARLTSLFFQLLFGICALALALSVVALFSAFSLTLLHDQITTFLPHLPESPTERFKTLVSLMGIGIATLTALLGVGVALWTYVNSVRKAARNQRKQHTITILFETRLSEQFQKANRLRKRVFPEYQDITIEKWNAARKATPEGESEEHHRFARLQNDGAEALQMLLNYYEFLAVGLSEGDLDEAMLQKTIRGIMCNLVDDARELIADLRANNNKTFENLIPLYEKWRLEGATDINGNPTERPIPKR